jgi:hypothetical protein
MKAKWLRIFDIKLSLDPRVIYIFKRVDGDQKVQLPYDGHQMWDSIQQYIAPVA